MAILRKKGTLGSQWQSLINSPEMFGYKSDLKFSVQGTEAPDMRREEKASWEKENPSGIAAA